MKRIIFGKLLPCFFGLTFLVCGILAVIKGAENNSRNDICLTANVVDYEVNKTEVQDSGENVEESNTYSPVFEYSLNGREYKTVSSVGYREKKFGIGERVDITVDPETPENIHIKETNTTLTVGIIFVCAGALALGYAVFSNKILNRFFHKENKDTDIELKPE